MRKHAILYLAKLSEPVEPFALIPTTFPTSDIGKCFSGEMWGVCTSQSSNRSLEIHYVKIRERLLLLVSIFELVEISTE